MKKIIQHLLDHKNLTKSLAKEVMIGIGKGNYTEAEVASFVTIYLMRTITIDELAGFREALLEMCNHVKIEADIFTDIVGTGGDGKNTFNISTLSCFLVAGAGFKVVKHGNNGVSSTSGSSNVLEYLGYKFTNENDVLQKQLDETNICFLHAPLFHPALKNVAQVRRNLGIRTIFNVLGPLVNPAQPTHSTLGVYHLEIARFYNYLLQSETVNYNIIHTMDGYDEISLTDDSKVITKYGDTVYSPMQMGKRTVTLADLHGGNSVEDAAKIFVDVLQQKGSWAQNAVVLANAAIAIKNMKNCSYEEAYSNAVESFESGAALAIFNKLISK